MRFKLTMFLELTFSLLVVLLLAGCFGDGGGPTYDGTWTAGYADSGFTPTVVSGVTPTCTVQTPLPTIKLENGAGSTSQLNTCTYSPPTVAPPIQYIYLISVAVTPSTGVVNAIVNGSALTGQCISAVGCGAQSGTKSLSLTR